VTGLASTTSPATHRYGTAERQHLLIYEPVGCAGPKDAVMLVHGGFWRAEKDAASLEPACLDLARRGLLVASADYRAAEAGGMWPACADDVAAAALAFAAAAGVPLASLVLAGHSAGGHLALLAAARLGPLRHVVGLAAITDLVAAEELDLGAGAVRGLLSGRPAGYEPAASPVHGPALACPVLMVHGTEDQTVPPAQSVRYADAMRDRGGRVRVRLIPGARHMHLVNPERPAWADIRAEILAAARQPR
jgi:acetyl esterase/lipase